MLIIEVTHVIIYHTTINFCIIVFLMLECDPRIIESNKHDIIYLYYIFVTINVALWLF